MHRMQRGGCQPSCAVQDSVTTWPQPHSPPQGRAVSVSVILWSPAVIPDVLVTSWPTFSLTGSFSSLTLLLFWLLMKIAAPGNFFPRNGQSGSCIVRDLHPFLLTMGFGLHARSGRLNCHSSITSDRPFPCTLQLPGCPQASRLEYHRLLLSTAVESGGAAGVSSAGG